jgi:hypothetical protein
LLLAQRLEEFKEFKAAAGTNGVNFSSKNGPRKKIEALTAV